MTDTHPKLVIRSRTVRAALAARRSIAIVALTITLAALTSACTGDTPVKEAPPAPAAPSSELRTMTARFAPADIVADTRALPESERRALGKLVEAARFMDSLFLRQVWAGNDALLQRLAREASGAREAQMSREARMSNEAVDRLHYFLINKGPWSRLDHNKPFVPAYPRNRRRRTSIPPAPAKRRSRNGSIRCRATPRQPRPASSPRFAAVRADG